MELQAHAIRLSVFTQALNIGGSSCLGVRLVHFHSHLCSILKGFLSPWLLLKTKKHRTSLCLLHASQHLEFIHDVSSHESWTLESFLCMGCYWVNCFLCYCPVDSSISHDEQRQWKKTTLPLLLLYTGISFIIIEQREALIPLPEYSGWPQGSLLFCEGC